MKIYFVFRIIFILKLKFQKIIDDFSQKFIQLKLFKEKNYFSSRFKILNELDKSFNDEEDIKKNKELL